MPDRPSVMFNRRRWRYVHDGSRTDHGRRGIRNSRLVRNQWWWRRVDRRPDESWKAKPEPDEHSCLCPVRGSERCGKDGGRDQCARYRPFENSRHHQVWHSFLSTLRDKRQPTTTFRLRCYSLGRLLSGFGQRRHRP